MFVTLDIGGLFLEPIHMNGGGEGDCLRTSSTRNGGGGAGLFHRQCEWNRSSKFCISFS